MDIQLYLSWISLWNLNLLEYMKSIKLFKVCSMMIIWWWVIMIAGLCLKLMYCLLFKIKWLNLLESSGKSSVNISLKRLIFRLENISKFITGLKWSNQEILRQNFLRLANVFIKQINVWICFLDLMPITKKQSNKILFN